MRQANLYVSIKTNVEEHGYRTETCCDILHVSRSAYYHWLSGKVGKRTQENERIAEIVEQIHVESPDKGYRRIRDDLERYHDTKISDKRALRICRGRDIKSTIKYTNQGCTRNAPNPQYQIHDSNVYLYFNTNLIAVHALSEQKLNYTPEHYSNILSFKFIGKDSDEIRQMAEENLRLIGGIYSSE